jgi:hypothetical protein
VPLDRSFIHGKPVAMLFHLFTFALMVAVSALYGSDLGWRRVVGFWAAFIAVTLVCNVLHAPGISILLRLAIAIAMLVAGRMRPSSFS